MSSNALRVELPANDAYIIGQMLKKARYSTAKLEPLTGPLHDPSQSILQRFIAATMERPNK